MKLEKHIGNYVLVDHSRARSIAIEIKKKTGAVVMDYWDGDTKRKSVRCSLAEGQKRFDRALKQGYDIAF